VGAFDYYRGLMLEGESLPSWPTSSPGPHGKPGAPAAAWTPTCSSLGAVEIPSPLGPSAGDDGEERRGDDEDARAPNHADVRSSRVERFGLRLRRHFE
jgi:hypothetical protein